MLGEEFRISFTNFHHKSPTIADQPLSELIELDKHTTVCPSLVSYMNQSFVDLSSWGVSPCEKNVLYQTTDCKHISRRVSFALKVIYPYFHKHDMTKVQSEVSEIGTESESMDVCLYVSFSSLTYELLICIETIRKHEYHCIKM